MRLQLASGGGGGGGGGGGSGFAVHLWATWPANWRCRRYTARYNSPAHYSRPQTVLRCSTLALLICFGTAEEVKTIKGELYDAAQRLQVGYAEMSNAAARMLPSLQEMGKGTADAVKLSEILMTTAKLSGASTQEATSAAQQFSQAPGSGVLNGDELGRS